MTAVVQDVAFVASGTDVDGRPSGADRAARERLSAAAARAPA